MPAWVRAVQRGVATLTLGVATGLCLAAWFDLGRDGGFLLSLLLYACVFASLVLCALAEVCFRCWRIWRRSKR